MKKLLLIIFLFAANSVLAAPLSLDIHTPDRPKSMQFAKVYFLPDWKDKGMVFEGDACLAYPLSFCPGYKIPAPDSYCPGNPMFFSACICPDSFIKCELPAFGSGAQCDDKYSVCTEDTERACKLENPDYTNSCPAGTKPDTAKRCSYDSDYGACCNTCAAYPESEVKDGYEQTAECTDCDGNTHYQIKPKDCGAGFMTCDNGGDIGAEECQSGEQTLYSSCATNLSNCEDGDILFSDKSCATGIIPGKTPIGIVFSSTSRLAVALDEKTLEWGGYGKEIGSAARGTSGKSNTAAILAYGRANNIKYPAAEYCNKYSITGTKTGDWFLASKGELKLLSDNFSEINTSLKVLGKAMSEDSNIYYWSSSEYTSDNAQRIVPRSGWGGMDKHGKAGSSRVRPVLAF